MQTGEDASLPKALVRNAIEEIRSKANSAIAGLESVLPKDFPEEIHASVKEAVTLRVRSLELHDAE